MRILILTVAWLATTANADDKCKGELKKCMEATPIENHTGLPSSAEEITTLCKNYKNGMECVEKWSNVCLTAETKPIAEKHMASVKFFMNLLCSDESYRKEYLNHTECFRGVSEDWTRCVREHRYSVREISDDGRPERLVDICCAKFGFNKCVTLASRAKCDASSAMMLRRISETLSRNDKCTKLDLGSICSSSNSYSSQVIRNFMFSFVVAISIMILRPFRGNH